MGTVLSTTVLFILLLLTILVLSLLRAYAELSRELHGRAEAEPHGLSPLVQRPRDVAAPSQDIAGTSVDGTPIKLTIVGRGHTLLAFLSSGCLTCKSFWDAIGDPGARRSIDGRIVIVTKGESEESPSMIRELMPRFGVQTVLSSSAWTDYDVPGSPYFMYLDDSGELVGEGSAASWEQVQTLIDQAARDGREFALRTSRLAQLRGDDDAAMMEAGISPDDPSLWSQVASADPVCQADVRHPL